ncbi:unnamed protein product [Blepharisma stoltei]|uniref:Alkaline phytoceramidase n=1 Tax=Blepharisma stoltei TaxID=1481888 RepID=A0AAU9JMZ3_9CILI|nr:unnamed protein product [Blepharisma stoltei]
MRYWDPITSSIDWCEANYEVSEYIVEFWNTVTSFALVVVGVYGLWVLRSFESRFVENLIAFFFIVVGVGSAAFHATLKYEYQLWDEIPMFWVISGAIYAYMVLFDYWWEKRIYLQWFFIIYNIVWYFVHSSNAFTVFFQANFFVLNTVMIVLMFYFHQKYKTKSSTMMISLYIFAILSAFSLWLVDKLMCEHVSQLPVNPQFHGWWHVLVASSAHYSLMFELVIRHTIQQNRMLEIAGGLLKYPINNSEDLHSQ